MISNREARAAKRAAAAEKRKQEVERKRREREEELKKQKEEQERQEKLKAELEDQRRKKEEERRWVILTCGCYNELFHEFKVCFNPRKITHFISYVLMKPSIGARMIADVYSDHNGRLLDIHKAYLNLSQCD